MERLKRRFCETAQIFWWGTWHVSLALIGQCFAHHLERLFLSKSHKINGLAAQVRYNHWDKVKQNRDKTLRLSIPGACGFLSRTTNLPSASKRDFHSM
jgi:hypothetical protein